VPQAYIKLVKNPSFFAADDVKVDEVYWYPTQNLATAFTRFRAGELDVVLNFPPGEIDWIKKNIPDSLHITDNLGVYFLVLNLRKPPYDDVRVRKALSLAVDREAITERLLRTGVRPAYSFATPSFSNYAGVKVPEQSLPFAERQSQARALLAEAGYGPGKPLTVKLSYDTQEENRKIMVAIAAMWQAIGVRTELNDVEFPMLNGLVRTMKYEVARWFYIAPFDDPYAMLQLFTSDNPNNWPGLDNPEFDRLLHESNLIVDPDERLATLAEAERLMLAEYPVLPISFYVGRRLVSPRVRGWVDGAGGPTPSRYLWVE
jgi:oligopeptide transport system substrate-binding protein